MKAGRVDHHVVQVLAAHAGVVHDDHIARGKAVQPKALNAVLHGNAQVGQKDGQAARVLADHAALGVNEAAAKVAHLVDHHVVGRLAQRQRHFFGVGDQGVGDHLQRDGV
jgi:hypothetical protein